MESAKRYAVRQIISKSESNLVVRGVPTIQPKPAATGGPSNLKGPEADKGAGPHDLTFVF